MKLCLSVIVALAVVCTSAHAQDVPPLTGRDVEIRIRDRGEPQQFYPEVAQKAHVEGHASALCDVAQNGDLLNCVLSNETPEGYRFGEATTRLASKLRIAPTAKDGTPTVGRKFQFEMNFKLPG